MEENNDLLASAIAGWANSLSCSSYRESGCLNVGELILLLENIDPDKTIGFVDGTFPKEFGSYRGSYSELSIEYDEGTPLLPETVGMFLLRLKDMIGKTIYGYKGGEYIVTEKTTVHKANYGHCGDIVVGIKENELSVDILTRDEDDADLDGEYDCKCKLKKLKDKPKKEKKVMSSKDRKKWIVDLVGPDGKPAGVAEIVPSKEKHDEPKCKLTDFKTHGWYHFKENPRMKEEYGNLIELVDLIRDISDREQHVQFVDYSLSTIELASEISKMDKHCDKLWNLFKELWSAENKETNALGKELEAYTLAFCCTVSQLWDRFTKIKKVSKKDVKDFYVFLENIGVDKLAELLQEKLVNSLEKGEL